MPFIDRISTLAVEFFFAVTGVLRLSATRVDFFLETGVPRISADDDFLPTEGDLELFKDEPF